MTATAAFDAELRRAADEFTMAVAVIADDRGVDPGQLAAQALGDSLARLTEDGSLGTSVQDDAE